MVCVFRILRFVLFDGAKLGKEWKNWAWLRGKFPWLLNRLL
jgi:hypothetical protein